MTSASMIVDHRRVGAAVRRLSLPLAVQMLGDQLLGIVDTIAIGSLGAVALAGVTAATTVFFTVIMTLGGLWSGLGIIAAQRIGAHDVDGFGRTVRAGFVIPCIAAIALAIASTFAGVPIIHLMIGSMASAHASGIYLALRCASLIPINISATLIVGLGAAGNRKLGIYLLAIINLVHIPLLLMLALGWWTHHPYGIVGAGISTLISEAIAAVFAVVYTARKPIYHVFSSMTLDWNLAARCAWLGLPESVFGLAIVSPDIAIVAMLAPLGAVAIGGFRALNVVSDLTFVVPGPLQSAAQTVIGQRLGARDAEGARWFLRRSLHLTLWVTSIAGVFVAIFAWPLAYLFTLNAVIASAAALPLAVHMITLPIKGWAMVSLSPIRAAGDTQFSMFVGILCGVLVLPIAWFCIERLHVGLFSIPIAWIVAWSARGALTAWRLRNDAWSRAEPLAA